MDIPRETQVAIADLRRGKPILLFDYPDREAETDLVFLAKKATTRRVQLLRRVAGAPLTMYLPYELAVALNLPTTATALGALSAGFPILAELVRGRAEHDPSFSITLDHRENFTGCSARESAHTIRRLAYYADHHVNYTTADLRSSFIKEFKTPGHVPVIICARGLLRGRNGHAELAMTLVQMGGLSKAVVASEMIDPRSGKPMSLEDAQRFARKRGIILLEGKDIIEASEPWYDELVMT